MTDIHSLATLLGTPCLYQVGPTFAFRTAIIIRVVDSTRCWKHSSEILVHIDMIASRSCCSIQRTVYYRKLQFSSINNKTNGSMLQELETYKGSYRYCKMKFQDFQGLHYLRTPSNMCVSYARQSPSLRINRTTNRNRKLCYWYAFSWDRAYLFYLKCHICHTFLAAHNYLL